tara:strand:+ start:29803 stop:30936 length:1134 start_codon:yes stop_codon:yes gene_type:complete
MKPIILVGVTLCLFGCYEPETITTSVNELPLSSNPFSVEVVQECPDDIEALNVGEITDPYSSYLSNSATGDLSYSLRKHEDGLAYFWVAYEQNNVKNYKTFYGIDGDSFTVHLGGSCSCEAQDVEILNANRDATYTINSIPQTLADIEGRAIIEDAMLCNNDIVSEGVAGQYASYIRNGNVLTLDGNRRHISLGDNFASVNIDALVGGLVFSNRNLGLKSADFEFHVREDLKEFIDITYQQLPSTNSAGVSFLTTEMMPEGNTPIANDLSVNMGYGVVQYDVLEADYLVGDIDTYYSVNGENKVRWSFVVSSEAMNFNADLYFPPDQEPSFAYSTSADKASYEVRIINTSGIPYRSSLVNPNKTSSEQWVKYSGFPF